MGWAAFKQRPEAERQHYAEQARERAAKAVEDQPPTEGGAISDDAPLMALLPADVAAPASDGPAVLQPQRKGRMSRAQRTKRTSRARLAQELLEASERMIEGGDTQKKLPSVIWSRSLGTLPE